ncbi:MAG TPA: FAD-dependent oxidoreductase [Chthoniobacteraceae bacterium]|nr:FAD-dependent oxidoreductase [Chthoniobacteraceae bacterium]
MTQTGRYGVVVAGGGSAGLAAALASARSGVRTLLLERHGSLGGMATAALVHSICGLYRLREAPGAVLAHRGFPGEFAARLTAAGGATGPVRIGRVDVLLTQPTLFAALADQLTAAEPNLTVRFHTEVTGVSRDSCGRLERIATFCRGRQESFEAASWVDATGDATLAALAGAPCEIAPTLQRPALIFALGGVETEVLHGSGRMQLGRAIAAAVRSGELAPGLLGVHVRPTARCGELMVTIDLDDPPGGPPFDPLSPASLSRMERYGRELAVALTTFLTRERDGFAAAYLAAFPARVGIRESRRIVGETRIETGDLLRGATFDDAVALSTWPIELREASTGPRLRFPEGDRPCEIPLRALKARGAPNLWAAGRCLSSSHEAQAALRVIGTCLATGEMAGLAAAMQARGEHLSASTLCAARELVAGLFSSFSPSSKP